MEKIINIGNPRKHNLILVAAIIVLFLGLIFIFPVFFRWLRTGLHYTSVILEILSLYMVFSYLRNKPEDSVLPDVFRNKKMLKIISSRATWVIIGIVSFFLYNATSPAPAPIFKDANGQELEQLIIEE